MIYHLTDILLFKHLEEQKKNQISSGDIYGWGLQVFSYQRMHSKVVLCWGGLLKFLCVFLPAVGEEVLFI